MRLEDYALGRYLKRKAVIQIIKLFAITPGNLYRVPAIRKVGLWATQVYEENDPWSDV